MLTDPNGLVLRFRNDLELIVTEDKKVMAVCEYLRYLATEKGIGSLTIEDHKMEQRMHEACLHQILAYVSIFITRNPKA